jgi:hypothetical protein
LGCKKFELTGGIMKKVPLSNTVHKDLRVDIEIDCSMFRHEYLLPVNVQEFPAAAVDYPVVFVKNGQTGQFQSVVMMGTQPGENLYCDTDCWDGGYVPEIMKNAPFSLGANNANKDEFFLCINEDSPQLNTKVGTPLFSKTAEQTEFLKEKTEDVVRYSEQAKFTQKFIDFLAKKDLLCAKSVILKFDDQPDKTISGIYVIDEEKLNQLSATELKKLQDQGAMPVLYAQINSLQRMGHLVKRKSNTSSSTHAQL